ncbi:MAG: D-alanyl-D-alanine carboxypeptidase, partial [Bacteroidetes bacterium]
MPVAGPLLNQFSPLTEDQVFNGFLGAETAPELHIIRDYVMGIDAGCK